MRLLLVNLLGSALLAGTARIDAPTSGWTSASATQLVVDLGEALPLPGFEGPSMIWLGRSWWLPRGSARVGVWLPVLPGDNPIAVRSGEGESAVHLIGAGAAPDLVVVAGWAPVGARLDLQVRDPDGESTDSSSRRSRLGGLRLRDDPESPGPHAFLLEHAIPGTYRVSLLCGRLPKGVAVPVQAIALVFPGTVEEQRFDLSGVVTRCDEVTELGTILVAGAIGSLQP
jgi:hypothetical protein